MGKVIADRQDTSARLMPEKNDHPIEGETEDVVVQPEHLFNARTYNQDVSRSFSKVNSRCRHCRVRDLYHLSLDQMMSSIDDGIPYVILQNNRWWLIWCIFTIGFPSLPNRYNALIVICGAQWLRSCAP